MKEVARGAEAIVCQDETRIVKERIPKGYRQDGLDQRLREQRTKQEARILAKLTATPEVHDYDDTTITMERVEGDLLTEVIQDTPGVLADVGSRLSDVHNAGIYHGDLTTSNIIVTPAPVFIDFGLGGHTDRAEDKAVDIYLLKKALESKHTDVHDEAWDAFTTGYDPDDVDAVNDRFHEVKQRGRYK